jgi:hypothetical protein
MKTTFYKKSGNKKPAHASNVPAFRFSLSRFALRLNSEHCALGFVSLLEIHPVNRITMRGELQTVLHRLARFIFDSFQDDVADDSAKGGQFDLQIFVSALLSGATVALAGDVSVEFHVNCS